MRLHTGWLNRIALLLIWVVVTAGVAFLVARNADGSDDATDLTAPVPSITTEQRSTVTLTERTISPVVSGDGSVMWDADDQRWLLVAPAEPAEVAYDLLDPPVGVKALIDGGPAGFDCAWAGLGRSDGGDAAVATPASATPVSATPASANRQGFLPARVGGDEVSAGGASSGGGVTMRCVIPDDVRVVAGLTGTMVLTMQPPTDALALPVTAVIGSEGRGQVVVVNDDGSTTVRDVQLGIADIFWIEITGGLEQGEQVLEFPTQYDFGPGSR